MNLAEWNLVEAETDKKQARTDHSFEWEQKKPLDATAGEQGAHTRVQLQVQGDEVSGYRIYIKIPESWRDKEKRSTPLQQLQSFGRSAGLVLVFITVLVVFFRNLKSPEVAGVPWSQLGKLSILMLLAGIVIYVNRAPQLLLNYGTTMPLAVYYLILSITMLFVTAIYLAGAVLALGLAWFFLERAFGPGCIPPWRELNGAYFRDAFCVALFSSAALLGLNRLPALLDRWPLLRHSLGASVPDSLDLLNPALGALASSIAAAFLITAMVGLAAGLIAAYVRPPWMRAALLILIAVLMTTNVASSGAFLRDSMAHLVFVAAIWYGVTRIVRFNVLGYFLLAAMLSLIPAAIELIQQPNAYLHGNGYAVVMIALAILAWPLLRWQRSA
jgi:hypothetical protein